MTAVVWIECDAETSPGERCHVHDTPPGTPRTATAARARLKRQGWHRTNSGRDICPDCWAQGRR